MIVDALTHITRDGSWFDSNLDASLDALLSVMGRDEVDKAVLAGIPGLDDDEIIVQASRDHPGRFLPVAGVDAALGSGALNERLQKIKAAGFVGIKLHPRFSGVPVNHPGIKEAVRLGGKLGLAAMICTIHRHPLPPLKRPLSDALYELCRECEHTRIILVHGGYTDVLATSEMIRPLEHVFLDLSLTLPRFAGTSIGLDMAWLLNHFDRRICLGSDFPEGNMQSVRQALSKLETDFEAVLPNMSRNLLKHLGCQKTNESREAK